MDPGITAFVAWPMAPLTEHLVRMSLAALDPPPNVISSIPESFFADGMKFIQWSTYDSIDHELSHRHSTFLSSSYTIRKALIRKHFLSRCIHSYLTKNGQSLFKIAVPKTWDLEISYADELDEMWSDELWDLGCKLDDPEKWWILKPGMADRGMGIRLFNSKAALQRIFEEFEGDSDDEETELDETAVMTSQLRHFVIQEYLSTPLLLNISHIQLGNELSPDEPESMHGHKFHLRAYFVASGAITLYMYPRILALFSAAPYSPPIIGDISEDGSHAPMDLTPHLTNTSLQTNRGEAGVRLLEELVGCRILSSSNSSKNSIHEQLTLTVDDVAVLKDQMANVLSETFKAVLEMPVHFQPIPNAFELFGVDFLVSHQPPSNYKTGSSQVPFQVQLLEINSEPAIELTGPRLTWILEDLFIAIGKVCIVPFFSTEDHRDQSGNVAFPDWSVGETRHGLQKCLELEMRGHSTQ